MALINNIVLQFLRLMDWGSFLSHARANRGKLYLKSLECFDPILLQKIYWLLTIYLNIYWLLKQQKILFLKARFLQREGILNFCGIEIVKFMLNILKPQLRYRVKANQIYLYSKIWKNSLTILILKNSLEVRK